MHNINKTTNYVIKQLHYGDPLTDYIDRDAASAAPAKVPTHGRNTHSANHL